MKTVITELLGIEYPIIQGGMAWVGTNELAAAVSEAGGLGIIGSGGAPASWVKEQIQQVKKKTSKPFGVNIMLMNPEADAIAQVIVDEGVPVVTTGAGNPEKYMEMWKAAGVKVIPVVASVALAKRMERTGADAVIAEGTESGGHIGETTTMALVPQVVDAVSIPVIGNGDITCPEDALHMYEETGCDGFMIGRRAKGNPWIFREVIHYFETGETLPRPSFEEVTDMMLRHGRMLIDFKGEYIGVREMRKHVSWYTFGFPGAAKLRDKVNHTETYQDLEQLLSQYLESGRR